MRHTRPLLARLVVGLGLCLIALVGPAATTKSLTRQEAARFLTQATFGPNEEEVAQLQVIGPQAWLDEQFAMQAEIKHLKFKPDGLPITPDVTYTFWQQALTARAQLRHRVAFALSEIFVVSGIDSCGSNAWQGIASYQDMLIDRAFGTYRQLLEAVTLHPMMGCYLSHLRNRKADLRTGRVPDENYAREVMQLFSIGLIALNKDGTPRLDAQKRSIETYGAQDVSGLARVFTGWSWDCPEYPRDECFQYRGTTPRSDRPDPWTVPMVPYPKFHETGSKEFLGVKIKEPLLLDADPRKDLKIALDTLAAHPNVGPFIGKQLIQRLVTSNPSPAYVARVAKAFDESKGKLQSTVAAILLDPEARLPESGTPSANGKIKEPILKLSGFLRAFGATSATGRYMLDKVAGLSQNPYMAPSVFNFFSPAYMPISGKTGEQHLIAPEMQVTNETSMALFAQLMEQVIWAGIGEHIDHKQPVLHPSDIKLEYQLGDGKDWLDTNLSGRDLVEKVNQRLMFGSMSEGLRSNAELGLRGLNLKLSTAKQADARVDLARKRLWATLLMTILSTEYSIQR
jgi:uncharacterized protein (DUF1800 family)